MKRCLMLLVALATIPATYALPTGEFPIAAHPTGFAPHDRRNVMIAATETTSLAVWEDFRVDPNQPPRIWATRIDNVTGKVLDTTGIQIVALPASTGTALRAVGTDGTDFLIAWTRGGAFDVFARHVLPDGTTGNEIFLGSASFYVDSAIWTGMSYAVGFSSDGGDAVGD